MLLDPVNENHPLELSEHDASAPGSLRKGDELKEMLDRQLE